MITQHAFSVDIRFCNDTVVLEGKGCISPDAEEYLDKILTHIELSCDKARLDLEDVPSISSEGAIVLNRLCDRYSFLELKNSAHLTLLFQVANAETCLARQK